MFTFIFIILKLASIISGSWWWIIAVLLLDNIAIMDYTPVYKSKKSNYKRKKKMSYGKH
jgi:hypothetical protein